MLKYILTALSLLLIGSVADVPAMFLAVHGELPLMFIFVTGFLADVLPDFFWYWLGTRFSIELLARLKFFKQNPDRLDSVGNALDRYGSLILFASKFVYWFGIPTQIMAGAHRFPLKKAAVANALGAAGWLAILYWLAHVFTSSAVAESYLKSARLDFTLFAGVALLLYFSLSAFFGHVVKVRAKQNKTF